MSLPALTTTGAAYRGAFRAQDATVNGSQHVSTLTGLVSGVDLTPRYWDSGLAVWVNTPTANVVLDATGLDGGPAIVNQGHGGLFTTASSLVDVGEGDHYWTTFVRYATVAPEWFMGVCGFEAWVANECVYLESGGAEQVQIDRGSSRRNRGPALSDSNAHTTRVEAYTMGDLNAYIDGGVTAQGNLSYSGPLTPGTLSAWMVGCVERTASAAFPPGVFGYAETTLWSRVVVVESVGGFLDSADITNLNDWVQGTDFDASTFQQFFWMCH